MKKEQKVTCLICPLGCEVTVKTDGNNIIDVSGQACKRGEKYAITEVTDPRRTLTTTVRVREGESPLVSVKSNLPLPKDLLMQSMSLINKTTIKAPVSIGDIVVKNILDTGVDIVATSAVL